MNSKPKKLDSRWELESIRMSRDQQVIRTALFRPSNIPMERCVVYLNGRTEWIEKNSEIPVWLDLPSNCGFLTLDHRGQGLSTGDRAYIKSYDDYISDVAEVLDAKLHNKIPYVILAHSMGGLISLYGVLNGNLQPQAMVLCAPLLKIKGTTSFLKIVAASLAKAGLAKKSTGGGSHDKKTFENNILTHSAEMFQIIQDAPYRVPSATFGWVHASFRAVDFVFNPDVLKNLSCPTLILGPSEDRVVDPGGWSHFIEVASNFAKTDKLTLHVIHGSRHELFSEIAEYRDIAIAKTKAWFSEFLKS